MKTNTQCSVWRVSYHAFGIAAHSEHNDLWRGDRWKLAILQPPFELLHAITYTVATVD